MMFRSLTAVAALSILAAGCATRTVALAPDQIASLSGKTFVGIEQKPPGFFHMTPVSGALGGLGALAMQVTGDAFRDDNGIVDPAPAVEQRLKEKFATRYAATAGETLDMKTAGDNPALPKQPGVIFIDARTTAWQYVYFSFDWGRYQTHLSTQFRLVDGATGTVLGLHDCTKSSPTESKNAPVEADLLKNKSELLNKLLAESADSCAAEFETKVLGSSG